MFHQRLEPPVKAGPFGLFSTFASDFLAFAGPRKWSAAVLLTLGALVEGIGLLLLLPLLSVVLGTGSGNGWLDGLTRALVALAPGQTPAARLAFLFGLFALLLACRAAIILARDVLLARLQVGFVQSHRLSIIRLLGSSDWAIVSRLQHSRITHVLGGDIQACGDAAQLTLLCCVAAAILVGQAVLVLILSPLLALLVVGLLLTGALLMRPVLRRSRAMGASLTESNLALVTGTAHFLGGLKLALSQNLQRSFIAEFEHVLSDAGSRRIAFVRQRTGAQLALTGFAALVAGGSMLVGIAFLGMTAATLIAFLFILARMVGPVSQIQNAAQHVAHSLPAYAKVKALEAELASSRPPSSDPDGTGGRLSGPIVFDRVCFSHATDGQGGVQDVSLTIEPGSFVGVTGQSGAGKTTFADLLVGLYPPQSGTITIGGRILAAATLAAWRSSISYVSQDPFLFHDTIRRNLLWAKPDAAEPELWEAIEQAGAGPLVRRLGLDSVVGERGTLISGGERQRIALARALLRRPSLLLLDEATNAIDVVGEEVVLRSLREDASRPTIILIAHRDASLAQCDRLIEFAHGQMIRDSKA